MPCIKHLPYLIYCSIKLKPIYRLCTQESSFLLCRTSRASSAKDRQHAPSPAVSSIPLPEEHSGLHIQRSGYLWSAFPSKPALRFMPSDCYLRTQRCSDIAWSAVVSFLFLSWPNKGDGSSVPARSPPAHSVLDAAQNAVSSPAPRWGRGGAC